MKTITRGGLAGVALAALAACATTGTDDSELSGVIGAGDEPEVVAAASSAPAHAGIGRA